ncbi:hypothetical protein PsorP6_013247 [Peronosclerospora sorghi]|uniref:Uncharacterized protein n=1 Tax=Peronosclerospora sorghi TaxID=230839 RepID=A0ACC0WI33_9STRA|nr:hypothetical protein PsorP6_013247 [Peronosclerospora sorghi]
MSGFGRFELARNLYLEYVHTSPPDERYSFRTPTMPIIGALDRKQRIHNIMAALYYYMASDTWPSRKPSACLRSRVHAVTRDAYLAHLRAHKSMPRVHRVGGFASAQGMHARSKRKAKRSNTWETRHAPFGRARVDGVAPHVAAHVLVVSTHCLGPAEKRLHVGADVCERPPAPRMPLETNERRPVDEDASERCHPATYVDCE